MPANQSAVAPKRLAGYLREKVFDRFPRGVWVLVIIHLFTSAGFSICLPFLPLYLHQERELTMTLIGSFFLIGGVASSATQMIGGVIADRLGRKRLLLGASLVRMIVYSGLAGLIATSAPVWAIIVTYITGQAIGMTMRPALTAMVADLVPADRLTETYGLVRVGQNIGWAAGPAVGGYLIAFLPYGWLFGMGALTTLITLALIFFFLGESFSGVRERATFSSLLSVARDGRFVTFTLLSLLVFMMMGQLGSTLSVFTVSGLGFTTAQYGLLLTANGVIVFLFQYPVARWADRLPRASGLALGGLLYGLGWISMAWVGSFGWAFAVVFAVTAAEIVFTPLTLATVGRLSPWDKRGRYLGFFGLSQSLSMSLAPLAGGVLLDRFTDTPIMVWAPIGAIGLLAAAGFHAWGRRQAPASPGDTDDATTAETTTASP